MPATLSLPASSAVFTFGYEGLAIDAFIERMKGVGIEWVVDVRELPLSRRKGFSKSAFREALAMASTDYSHRPSLGCPKPVKDRYRVPSSIKSTRTPS